MYEREGGERERERRRGMCVGCSASMGLSRPIECKQKTEQFYANYAKHHTAISNAHVLYSWHII